MRPSISMTLEPGLDRGVPWGRDLYTFVTSAAGHMMRTLQKPRKNRPSKRQVNHRRFLHNMIQRKFADIEAANHRLASALYFKDEDKKLSPLALQKSATPEQSEHPSQGDDLQESDKCSADGDGLIWSRSYISVVSHETETSQKGNTQSGRLWRHFPKSQQATWTTRENNQAKGRQKFNELLGFMSVSSPKCIDHVHTVYYDEENPLEPDNNLPGDLQTHTHDAGFIQFGLDVDASPSFSPELSPLSLDSCDLSVQMFTDISNCTLAQRSIADVAESHWGDMIDLFSAKDFGGCADVEAFFESICSCQGDAGVEVGADEVGDVLRCDYGYGCLGNQGLTTNYLQSDQSSSQRLFMNQNEETHFNNYPTCHGPNITQTEPPTSISCSYNISASQMYQQTQEQSACMMGDYGNNQSFTPFEGVAQSFSAPVYNLELCPVPTPPYDEDWLFTDILRDGTTLDL